MGAVTFSLDTALVDVLKSALPLSTFVETGTFEGDTVANVAHRFDEIHTVELSEEYVRKARERFADMPSVHVHAGESVQVLRGLRPSLEGKSVLYFLDAHWCVADSSAGSESQCPLLEEIAAIGSLGERSAIVIDDARLFLATPPEPHEVSHWPSFDEVTLALRKLSDGHATMVVNDVIAFYPRAIERALRSYARQRGVDWLRARQSLDENLALRGSLEALRTSLGEKEDVIRSLEADIETAVAEVNRKETAIEDLTSDLEEKQRAIERVTGEIEKKEAKIERQADIHRKQRAVIREQKTALQAYRVTFALVGFVLMPLNRALSRARRWLRQLRLEAPSRMKEARARLRLRERSTRWLEPRLGVLNQHPPRAVALPASYRVPVKPSAPMKISIVTPSFQQAEFIERTIRSVVEQDYPLVEYFVQDGGSNDGTVDILRRYEDRLAGWDSRRDKGQTEAINRGFAHTDGEIMAWLNSDDVLFPGALAYVADYFARHPDIDVVYGHRILIDENDQEIGRWMLPAHSDAVLSWADFIPQETMFFRRRIWEKVGARVDESFRFAMDWDLIVRFRDAGARFARLPRFLGGFRIHAQQKTSAVITDIGFQEMNRIRERALGRVPSSVEVRRALIPYLVKHVATDIGWRIQSKLGFRS